MSNSSSARLRESSSSRAPILVVVVLALVLAAVGIAMQLYAGAAQHNADRASTFLLRERTAYGYMADMQTAQRGYVITSNSSFLAPYNEGVQKLPAVWAELHDLAQQLDQPHEAGTQPLEPLTAAVISSADEGAQHPINTLYRYSPRQACRVYR